MSRNVLSLAVLSLLLMGGALLSSLAHEPNEASRPGVSASSDERVTLWVQLPQEVDVRLWANGQEANPDDQPAEFTRFVSVEPREVVAGAKAEFVCELRVVWEPNNYTVITRERTLRVKPGGNYHVDLSRPDPRDKPDDIVVIYVPTPDAVVDHLLDLAKVGPGDVVFDLGCGDGRMVCRAIANRGAARGVGVDIDPDRIEDSRETARQYDVADKVQWREGDVLKSIDDLSEASVVMLYMGDDIGARLAPLLQQKLKPGSRVVSHRFHLGDWKPDRTITVEDPTMTNEDDHVDLHLWIVKPQAEPNDNTPAGDSATKPK